MKLDLVFPCDEDLSSMEDTQSGKFCSQCNKDVIDFTSWDKEDIIQYLSKKKSCGIFKNEQLDRIQSNPIVHIRPKMGHVKKLLASAAILVSALFGCNDRSTPSSLSVNPEPDNGKVRTSNCSRTLGAPLRPRIEEVIDAPVKGDTKKLIGDTIAPPEYVGLMAGGSETVAEFPQGEDSLLNFLIANVQYPKYESQNKIEGIVYASFSVEKDGSVKAIKIEKSVEGSKCFDEEVIRVLSLMPKWKPAERDGEPVQSFFTIPINFSLD